MLCLFVVISGDFDNFHLPVKSGRFIFPVARGHYRTGKFCP